MTIGQETQYLISDRFIELKKEFYLEISRGFFSPFSGDYPDTLKVDRIIFSLGILYNMWYHVDGREVEIPSR